MKRLQTLLSLFTLSLSLVACSAELPSASLLSSAGSSSQSLLYSANEADELAQLAEQLNISAEANAPETAERPARGPEGRPGRKMGPPGQGERMMPPPAGGEAGDGECKRPPRLPQEVLEANPELAVELEALKDLEPEAHQAAFEALREKYPEAFARPEKAPEVDPVLNPDSAGPKGQGRPAGRGGKGQRGGGPAGGQGGMMPAAES